MRKKLVIFSDSYAPQVSGVAKRYENLLVGLQQEFGSIRNWEVQLHAPNYSHQYVPSNHNFIYYQGKPWFLSENIIWTKPNRSDATRKVGRFGPDVIHIATEGPIGQMGRKIARQYNIPYTIASHTDYVSYLPKYKLPKFLSPVAWAVLKQFYSGSEYVIVPSEWHRNYLLDNIGDLNYRVWTYGVPDAFHVSPYLPKREFTDTVNLLYVGRLAPEKNLAWIITAWNYLSPKYPKATLTIVGSGPSLALFQNLKHSNRIRITGPLHGKELITEYRNGDIFLCPSETETFGNVVAEAGCARNAVITSEQGAAPSVLKNALTSRTGLDFTDSIEMLLSNSEALEHYQLECCKEAQEKYSTFKFVKTFTDTLEEAIS